MCEWVNVLMFVAKRAYGDLGLKGIEACPPNLSTGASAKVERALGLSARACEARITIY